MNRSICIILIVAGAFAGTELLMAQTKPSAPSLKTFAIIYQPGPNWIKGKSIYEQPLYDHAQYMAKLLDQGHLEMAGPFSDSSGGMAIVTAKNKAEASNILKNDPGVTTGVFLATLRPWHVVFRKQAP
jgi:uncharacterized protein YciI